MALGTTALAAPFAYITDGSQNTPVIDVATKAVVGNFGNASGAGLYGVAVSPDGAFIYGAQFFRNRLMVYSAAGALVARVPMGTNNPDFGVVGSNPLGVAVTPDGAFVYVTNNFENSVSVLDTAINTVVVKAVPVGAYPAGVEVTPDGRFVYVANSGSNTVSVLATDSNTVIATIPVGGKPYGVAATPDSKFVYVTNRAENTVSVIATRNNKVVATVAVGLNPFGVDVTPDGDFVYVSNYDSNTVSVISTNHNIVKATVPLGETSAGPVTHPTGITVTPDGSTVYVATFGLGYSPFNNVSVISTATNVVSANVAITGMTTSPVAFGRFICRQYRDDDDRAPGRGHDRDHDDSRGHKLRGKDRSGHGDHGAENDPCEVREIGKPR
jgi:YVTN family beta-propeller protein